MGLDFPFPPFSLFSSLTPMGMISDKSLKKESHKKKKNDFTRGQIDLCSYFHCGRDRVSFSTVCFLRCCLGKWIKVCCHAGVQDQLFLTVLYDTLPQLYIVDFF